MNIPRLDPKQFFSSEHLIFSLAPLEPFTANPITRELAGLNGADLVFRPKIQPFHLLKAKEWQLNERICGIELLKTNQGRQVYDGFQLIARPDDPIKDAVRYISQNAKEIGISFIDLNFSCPGHKVRPENRGGELMRTPDKIAQVIEKTLKFTHLPVSIKIRRAYDKDDMKENPQKIIELIKQYDLAWVTINRATVKMGQMEEGLECSGNYGGDLTEDNSAFEKSAQLLIDRFPVIANGAISLEHQVDSISKINNCKGVMIGRSAMGNPEIFKNLKSKQPDSINNLDNISENDLINSLEALFDLIHRKYSKDSWARWATVSNLKLILFHYMKHFFLQNKKQMPHGLGWAAWKQTKFTKESLIHTCQTAFPFIERNKLDYWFSYL
jgi:tRNA-dihydrouridine synthase